MLRFTFVDIYKNANRSYQKYKENLYYQKKTFENKNGNCFTKDSESLIVKKQNIYPLYFDDEKYKRNRDYSKFIYIANKKEKTRESSEEKSDSVITLTLTALFVGIGVYVFRRSFYMK